MELIISILIGIGGFVIGSFTAIYLAVQPALLLIFAIPFTCKARSAGFITSHTPLIKCICSFIILSLILVLLSTISLLFLPNAFFIGYIGANIYRVIDALKPIPENNRAIMQDVLRAVGPYVPDEKTLEFPAFLVAFFNRK